MTVVSSPHHAARPSQAHSRFYTGRNRKQMFRAFERLVDAMRRDDFSHIVEYATLDCIANTSLAGRRVGLDRLASVLTWPGPATSVSRATILNFVARSRGNRGIQAAYVQCLRSVEGRHGVDVFLYGLQFHNEFALVDGRWKLAHIRVDLCYESGNNDFVRGRWQLMNHALYAGHTPMILPELHNPWRNIVDDEESQTDQEQVFELFSKYAFAFDHGDFEFLRDFVTDDFTIRSFLMRSPDHGDADSVGYVRGVEEVLRFLKPIFHSEAKIMHAFRMSEVHVTGDAATAVALRAEDHRLRNAEVDAGNVHCLFTTAVHSLKAVRDSHGAWRMREYSVEPIAAMFTPTPDSSVVFDEFLVEGGSSVGDLSC